MAKPTKLTKFKYDRIVRNAACLYKSYRENKSELAKLEHDRIALSKGRLIDYLNNQKSHSQYYNSRINLNHFLTIVYTELRKDFSEEETKKILNFFSQNFSDHHDFTAKFGEKINDLYGQHYTYGNSYINPEYIDDCTMSSLYMVGGCSMGIALYLGMLGTLFAACPISLPAGLAMIGVAVAFFAIASAVSTACYLIENHYDALYSGINKCISSVDSGLSFFASNQAEPLPSDNFDDQLEGAFEY